MAGRNGRKPGNFTAIRRALLQDAVQVAVVIGPEGDLPLGLDFSAASVSGSVSNTSGEALSSTPLDV
jgi:hypothetical protein